MSAVRLGFELAKTRIVLMILASDLTVSPRRICEVYRAHLDGKGETLHGSGSFYTPTRRRRCDA